MGQVAVVGLDIAKCFQVHGVGRDGKVVVRRSGGRGCCRFSRRSSREGEGNDDATILSGSRLCRACGEPDHQGTGSVSRSPSECRYLNLPDGDELDRRVSQTPAAPQGLVLKPLVAGCRRWLSGSPAWEPTRSATERSRGAGSQGMACELLHIRA